MGSLTNSLKDFPSYEIYYEIYHKTNKIIIFSIALTIIDLICRWMETMPLFETDLTSLVRWIRMSIQIV